MENGQVVVKPSVVDVLRANKNVLLVGAALVAAVVAKKKYYDPLAEDVAAVEAEVNGHDAEPVAVEE